MQTHEEGRNHVTTERGRLSDENRNTQKKSSGGSLKLNPNFFKALPRTIWNNLDLSDFLSP